MSKICHVDHVRMVSKIQIFITVRIGTSVTEPDVHILAKYPQKIVWLVCSHS
nr:hypothetical protein Itr_chr03CG04770 [Ipomoea trifida]